jgi:polyisoprenoid-binding protein YceI
MRHVASLSALVATLALAVPAIAAAENYMVDAVHSSAVFRIKHANTSFFWGRFNDPAGSFAIDEADPTKSTFTIELDATKVDTGNGQRDAHLKSPDFFNAKQYPKITFKSTSVKKGKAANLLEVTGDLTMHGVTKPITVPVELTGKGEFPPGKPRAGVEATIAVKMSDFGFKPNAGLSDEVRVIVSLSGMKQ